MSHQTPLGTNNAGAIPALTLALVVLGGIGGWVALSIGIRAPWFFGALVTTTLLVTVLPHSLRQRAPVPRPVSKLAVTLLAAVFGGQLGQQLDGDLSGWMPSLVAVILFVFLAQGLGFWYYRRIGRLDRKTAWFAASPGGLVESAAQFGDQGADQAQVALMHFLRIMIIVLVLPLGYSIWFGLAPRPPIATFSSDGFGGVADHMVLVAVVSTVFLVLRVVAIPGGPLILSFVIAAVLSLTGLSGGTMSPLALALGQVVIGAALGSRFGTLGKRETAQAAYLAIGHTALILVLALVVAVVLQATTGLSLWLGMLILAPAGIAEMAVIGASLGAEPLFIIVHHAIRLGATILVIPPLLVRMEKCQNRSSPDQL